MFISDVLYNTRNKELELDYTFYNVTADMLLYSIEYFMIYQKAIFLLGGGGAFVEIKQEQYGIMLNVEILL